MKASNILSIWEGRKSLPPFRLPAPAAGEIRGAAVRSCKGGQEKRRNLRGCSRVRTGRNESLSFPVEAERATRSAGPLALFPGRASPLVAGRGCGFVAGLPPGIGIFEFGTVKRRYSAGKRVHAAWLREWDKAGATQECDPRRIRLLPQP